MGSQTKGLTEYFSLLFSDWLNNISNAVTIVSLLIGFLNDSRVPEFLSHIPREGYIALAFIAFMLSNYRIYRKIKKHEGIFDFKISKIEAGIVSEIFVGSGQDFSLASDVKFQIAARLFVENVGAQTAVHFNVISLSPIPIESVKGLEVNLTKPSSGSSKLDNPYYFKPDDMLSDLQIKLAFSVDLGILEKTYGTLGKVGTVKLTIGATPTGRKTIEQTIECDLSHAFRHQLEERISDRVYQNLPAIKTAFNLMKRYWLGPEKDD